MPTLSPRHLARSKGMTADMFANIFSNLLQEKRGGALKVSKSGNVVFEGITKFTDVSVKTTDLGNDEEKVAKGGAIHNMASIHALFLLLASLCVRSHYPVLPGIDCPVRGLRVVGCCTD